MTDLPSLLATLRDMRALSGDPLVVRVCDDAAEVIEKQGGDGMSRRLPDLVPLDFDLERIAERARRRDLFAAAALTGLLANPERAGLTASEIADDAVLAVDRALAALDAAAGPTSVEVPPSPATRPGETERP